METRSTNEKGHQIVDCVNLLPTLSQLLWLIPVIFKVILASQIEVDSYLKMLIMFECESNRQDHFLPQSTRLNANPMGMAIC